MHSISTASIPTEASALRSIVATALQTQTFTLQQEEEVRTLLQHYCHFPDEALESVITLLEALSSQHVIPIPSRVCSLFPCSV